MRRIAVDHPCPPVAARIRKNAEAPVWRERGLIGTFKRRGEFLPPHPLRAVDRAVLVLVLVRSDRRYARNHRPHHINAERGVLEPDG